MDKRNKNKRGADKKELKVPSTKPPIDLPELIGKGQRASDKTAVYEKTLIICEGETEAGYFKALTYHWKISAIVDVSPEFPAGYPKGEGGALKTMLKKAIEKLKERNYKAVWLVTDNDEQNAYKLAELEKIKNYLGEDRETWFSILSAKVQMDVLPEEVEKGKDKRARYFLHRRAYTYFLLNELSGANTHEIEQIIALTEKRVDLETLYDYPEKLLDEKDLNALTKTILQKIRTIKIAYCSIAFEHWLLLHFEYNEQARYNSREYYPQLISAAYFNDPNFGKGWYLYEKLEQLKSFFERAEKAAAYRALRLMHTYAEPQIAAGLRHFEINPYTDVHHLVGELRGIIFVKFGDPIHLAAKSRLINFTFLSEECSHCLCFTLDIKKHVFKRSDLIEACAIRNGETFTKIETTFSNNTPFFRDGDILEVHFELQNTLAGYIFSFDVSALFPAEKKRVICWLPPRRIE